MISVFTDMYLCDMPLWGICITFSMVWFCWSLHLSQTSDVTCAYCWPCHCDFCQWLFCYWEHSLGWWESIMS